MLVAQNTEEDTVEPPPHLMVITLAEVACLVQAEAEDAEEAVAVRGVHIPLAAVGQYLQLMEPQEAQGIHTHLVAVMVEVLAQEGQAEQ